MQTIKNKRFILWSVIIIFLVLLFWKMNDIVYLFINDDLKLMKVNWEEYQTEQYAYAYMNSFEYNSDDLLETVKCNGWAFAETNESNENKEVNVILKGTKNTYITSKSTLAADDISKRFPDWKEIPGESNNFTIEFSTLSLPNDVYEIYVYVKENDVTKGLVKIGQTFKKEGVKLYEYEVGQKIEEIAPLSIKNNLTLGWINITNVNDCVKVSGWCAIENVESEYLNYYVVYLGDNNKNVTINVMNQYRTDVAESLGNDIYMGSGFVSCVSNNNLPDSAGDIYVVVENNGKYYVSAKYQYDIEKETNQ